MSVSGKKIVVLLPNIGGGDAGRLNVNLSLTSRSSVVSVKFILMRKYSEFGALLPLLSRHVSVVKLGVDRIRSNPIIPYKQ